MAVDLDVMIGTVSFTNYLHVTAAKVASPTVVEFETWIPVPVTNYTLVIPGLDPDIYYITFYEAATSSSLGTLRSQLKVNGLTSEFIYERRFYTCDGSGTYDPVNGDTGITDPYFLTKTITGVFKEGFRYFDPATELTVDTTVVGNVNVTNGSSFSTDEVIIVELKYNSGVIAASSNGGLYSGTKDVSAATYTMLSTDRNKRVRLVGTVATQEVTMPTLSSLAVDDGYYFDNSVGGTAKQVKLLMQGGDRIRYNGFDLASDEFAEFWVSKGQHLLIKKYDSLYYEVITDFKGVCVGERIAAGFKDHPLIISENGQLMDGDEWPLMWWWINNVLPNTHYYITDTVTGIFIPDSTKPGQFAIHSTLKKFRMPSTFGLSEKGLGDFETYGADTANRPVDYPGGYQADAVKKFWAGTHATLNILKVDGTNTETATDPGAGSPNIRTGVAIDQSLIKDENRVKNFGVIYARRMG